MYDSDSVSMISEPDSGTHHNHVRAIPSPLPPPLTSDRSYVNLAKPQWPISENSLTRRRKISLMRKIGIWNFIIIIVGSLFICGILGFLWYLV